MFGLFERFTSLIDAFSGPSPAQEMASFAKQSREYGAMARSYSGMKNEQGAARLAVEQAQSYARKARGDY